MAGPLPLVAFTDREGPEETWTLYDFFGEGLEDGVMTLVFDDPDEEDLAPFRDVGAEEIETEEFEQDCTVLAALGEEPIRELLPELTRGVIEVMAPDVPELFARPQQGESRTQRTEVLYMAGYTAASLVIGMLVEALIENDKEERDEK